MNEDPTWSVKNPEGLDEVDFLYLIQPQRCGEEFPPTGDRRPVAAGNRCFPPASARYDALSPPTSLHDPGVTARTIAVPSDAPGRSSEATLRHVLEQVNLAEQPERVGGWDVELDWADILSLGEQQLLAFARLLLTEPQYAILDEATSALDVKNEAHLYRMLQAIEITYISAGHRPSVLQYHQHVLELTGEGRWRLLSVETYMREEGNPSQPFISQPYSTLPGEGR